MAEAQPQYSESTMVNKLLSTATLSPPPALAQALEHLAPVFKVFGKVINVVGPIYMKLFDVGMYAYQTMPIDLFQACLGLGLCFCGGSYVASIAAIEAFRMTGWATTKQALLDIAEEMKRVKAANEADNKKDDDGNGVVDVQDLTASQLLQRK